MTHNLRFRCSIPVVVGLFLAASAIEAQYTQQGTKLVGTGAVGAAIQGNSVSLSADGNTAIVGGYGDNSNEGAVWVYTRSGGVWTQQGSKLVGTGAVGVAQQGYVVSLSADGNTAFVGGYSDNSDAGAAWVYTRSGGVWTQQGSKLVGTGAVGAAYQGISVSLSADGNTAIVGGAIDNSFAGASWVYTRSGGVWTQQGTKLVGTGAVGAARQGYYVALSADGNTAIVGGYGDNSFAGAAWVYTRSGGVWTQQGTKLVGTGAVGNTYQGISVSLSADGNTAIVGGYRDNSSAGASWVYTRSGGVWTQQGTKLVGTGAVGAANQGVSVSLSADGNTAIAGGYLDNSFAGAVWVYTRSGGVWTQQGTKLVGTGAAGTSLQGYGVSLSADGTTAIVGGYGDNSNAGAAWFYYGIRAPVTSGIADIPDDQGGEVRLTWEKSTFDDISLSPQVTTYSIFRRSSSELVAAQNPELPLRALLTDSSLIGYDYLVDVPALQLPTYQAVVPTLADSSASGIPWFNFLVVARTEDIDQYYVSAVDSGYSLDNLSPVPPAGLIATVVAGPEVDLTWNSPVDPDVGRYDVHRSTVSGFTPSPGNLIGASGSTSFTDASPVEGIPSYYRIVAVDVHDNPSGPSDEAEAAVTINAQFNVQAKWNIVSVPLTMGDYTKTVLFPNATTNASAFEDGYVAYGILESGRGYWLRFPAGESISHDGLERTLDTIEVVTGWNLVGSLSSPIPASSVGSVPGGIVTSSFYRYEGSYVTTSTLEPGAGYWVKASQAGQLVMSTTGMSPSNLIRIQDTGELPPPPPERGEMPHTFSLDQNYPNPFNPSTTIRYALPAGGKVRVSIFNTLGQEVMVLVDQIEEAGYRSVSFDAGSLPSGVYLYKITAGTFTDTKKMLFMK